jgi:branched-chain amino acid transport system substrate-binding protein
VSSPIRRRGAIRTGIAVLLLPALLAGCSKASSSSSPTSSADTSGAAASPVSGDTITIGATLPLSGAQAASGTQLRGGMDIAVAEINAAGGAGGKKIVIDYQDDQIDPAKAVTEMQDLAGKGIKIVMSAGSAVIGAETPVAKDKGMLIANIAAQNDSVLLNDQVFSFIPTNDMELGSLATLAYTTKGLKNVAVIHTDDSFGNSAFEAFSSAYKALGGTIVDEEKHPSGTTSFSTYLIKIRSANPDGLVVLSETGEVGHIIANAKQQSLNIPILSSDPALGTADTATAGAAMEGVSGVAIRFDPTSSAQATAFAQKFKEANKVDAISYSAIAYVAIEMLAKALTSVGSDDPTKIRAYLQGVKNEPSLLGPVSAADGKPVLAFAPYNWTWEDGKVQALS